MARPTQNRLKKPWKSRYSDSGSKWETREVKSMVGKMRRRCSARTSLRAVERALVESGASSGMGVERPLQGKQTGPLAVYVFLCHVGWLLAWPCHAKPDTSRATGCAPCHAGHGAILLHRELSVARLTRELGELCVLGFARARAKDVLVVAVRGRGFGAGGSHGDRSSWKLPMPARAEGVQGGNGLVLWRYRGR